MGKLSPRIPREHNKYHGYTVRGTPHSPLISWKWLAGTYLEDHPMTCKWLITMVIVSPLSRVVPLISGLFMAYKWAHPPSMIYWQLELGGCWLKTLMIMRSQIDALEI